MCCVLCPRPASLLGNLGSLAWDVLLASGGEFRRLRRQEPCLGKPPGALQRKERLSPRWGSRLTPGEGRAGGGGKSASAIPEGDHTASLIKIGYMLYWIQNSFRKSSWLAQGAAPHRCLGSPPAAFLCALRERGALGGFRSRTQPGARDVAILSSAALSGHGAPEALVLPPRGGCGPGAPVGVPLLRPHGGQQRAEGGQWVQAMRNQAGPSGPRRPPRQGGLCPRQAFPRRAGPSVSSGYFRGFLKIFSGNFFFPGPESVSSPPVEPLSSSPAPPFLPARCGMRLLALPERRERAVRPLAGGEGVSGSVEVGLCDREESPERAPTGPNSPRLAAFSSPPWWLDRGTFFIVSGLSRGSVWGCCGCCSSAGLLSRAGRNLGMERAARGKSLRCGMEESESEWARSLEGGEGRRHESFSLEGLKPMHPHSVAHRSSPLPKPPSPIPSQAEAVFLHAPLKDSPHPQGG